MAVKVLVTAIGQHILADVKQVENQETNELVAYWLRNAQIVRYTAKDGKVNMGLAEFCPVATGAEFSIRVEHVIAILDPRDDVLETYQDTVSPKDESLIETEVV